MEKITTVGLDIAKQVSQVHGINGAGVVVGRRKLRRDDVVGYFQRIALANKMARIVWALMTTGRRFEAAAAL